MMVIENLRNKCEAIEECYEFMLAYAAQGIIDDRDSKNGSMLRELLSNAIAASSALPVEYSAMVTFIEPTDAQKYFAFHDILKEDTAKAMAAMELVLIQPCISSQLIDNLNASLHIRTLLTDMFLIDEILKIHCPE